VLARICDRICATEHLVVNFLILRGECRPVTNRFLQYLARTRTASIHVQPNIMVMTCLMLWDLYFSRTRNTCECIRCGIFIAISGTQSYP
jgi:hypothetical protein